MKYFIHIVSLLVAFTFLTASDNYIDQDSRDKLKQYDIEKAEKNQPINSKAAEIIQKEKINNQAANNSIIHDLDALKLFLKQREYLNNQSIRNNNRDCVDEWLGDSWCDETNNTDECGWDGGDCCPGDCVGDGCQWAATCNNCLDPESDDNSPGGACWDGSCENVGLVTCSDNSCAENICDCPIPPCIEDCGLALCWDNSCIGLDEDCPDTCEDQGLVTCDDLSCEATEDDCIPPCDDGYVADCDGSGDCCSAGWVGDGLCDGTLQGWGCDLTCYECDGGDCLGQDGEDVGCVYCEDEGLVTCWDYSCVEDESDCPEITCSDTDCGYYISFGYFCDEIESLFGYDCSVCQEEGSCPLTCEDEGLVTCPDESCAPTEDDCPDASCADIGGIESWIADGYCDGSNNNETCGWDGGDCCGSTCLASSFDCVGSGEGSYGACYNECLDPNANDDCCIDNTCPFTCEGNGLVTCWDSSCAETEADCPEITCADTDCGYIVTSGFYDYTCPEVEQMYGNDCSVCEEEGACPLTCEDQGLITCFSGECANSEEECNGCENPGEAVEGSNASEGYDEFYSFSLSEGGFLTLSTAGAGIDTKLYLYPADCDVATTFDDFETQYIAYNDDWGSSQFGVCPDCTYWGESYIYVGVPAGDYIIVSSDSYNSSHNPFDWTLSFEVGVEGCTNETANNYDPEANIDDGTCEFDDGVYFITCDGGSWQTEVSWDLTNEDTGDVILSGGAPFEGSAALEPAIYYVQAYDSFGDGWNGNILTIIDSESNEVLSYTLEEGSEGMSESFTVEGTGCALLGDVNEDGTVNVIDIVSIVNGILGTDTEDLMLCGDYNEDGELNVIDIVGIVNAILGS